MDILQIIVSNVKSSIQKVRNIYGFVVENFLPGISDEDEPVGFSFF